MSSDSPSRPQGQDANAPSPRRVNRRRFIATAGAALALPIFVPGCAVGLGSRPRPSNRITLGVVGWGWQGPDNTEAFMASKDCQVVAACDLDKGHLQSAVRTINDHYKNEDCKAYHDYRAMMAREDIDAVMLAVPDHWHELVATEAARRGKDIYGEKPLARTIAEQQNIVQAVQKHHCIWQTGSWQRSRDSFQKAAEIVRNGLIGKITRVEVGLPSGHSDNDKQGKALLDKLALLDLPQKVTLETIVPGTAAWDAAVTQPPDGFDFDTWLGPSRKEPYIQARIHKNWRWNYNCGGGQLMDWIGHHCDIAHWGMDCDNSGPLEVEGHGEFPAADAIWNTCTKYRIELKYPKDIAMTISGGHDDIKDGAKWIGTEGWVWVDREHFKASNTEWEDVRDLPETLRKVKLYHSRNHQQNFLDCVKSRQPTITPVETAHHSTIPGHLGLISMLVGRKIHWDAKHEKIIGDPEASKLMTRPYRPPWKMG
ncbi:MAG: Gfo/Idh/MocA family oxidoreductase [Verrucomicrobiota bacterium]|jgi:predicted dehydrogenase